MSESLPPAISLSVTTRDHVRGSSSAVVTLLVYGDYQCPFTRAVHPVVKNLQRHFDDRLRFVFRHFPLPKKHPDAQRAAEAAEAAGGQGKFWEMHDHLFERLRALDAGSLVLGAERLGLDAARFGRELAEYVYADRVQQDVQSGIDSGVSGTPTIFLNGVRSAEDDEDDFETLKAKVEAAIRFTAASDGKART